MAQCSHARTSVTVAAAALALLAAACSPQPEQKAPAAAAPEATIAELAQPSRPADVSQSDVPDTEERQGEGPAPEESAVAGQTAPSPGTDAQPGEPELEKQRSEIQQEIAKVAEDASAGDVPPAELAELVIEAAENAAPESELTLGICTQWVADPELMLNEQQAQECAAIAAAVEACEELDCFGEDTPEAAPEPDPEAATTTTAPPEPEAATTTTAPPEPEAATTTTAPPEPEAATTTTAPPEPEAATTTTAPPEPEAATTTTAPPEPEAATTTTAPPEPEAATTTTAPPEPEQPDEEPEAEATDETSTSDWVAPHVGLVPEVHPDTPPTSWERGDLQPGTRPIETPRSTGADRVQVAEWINWMGAQPTTYRQWLMYNMKWALDYLGAHPACVIPTYYDRVVTSNEVTLPGRAEPGYLRDLYGWHICATVIDPFIPGVTLPDRANDIGLRLSDTPGVTLAERCRTVLPDDIQLEAFRYLLDANGNRVGEPDYYPFEPGHAGCDEWAEWAESYYWFIHGDYPECFRSAQLASEWMEHHYGAPEINVTC